MRRGVWDVYHPCGTMKFIEIDELRFVELKVVCIEKGL